MEETGPVEHVETTHDFFKEFQTDIVRFQADVAEICDKQENFTKDLREIKDTVKGNDVEGVDTMMQVVKVYKDKLSFMRNRMLQIHAKTKSLKEKSLNLQRVAMERCADRVEKQYYEESLIKKPTKTLEHPKQEGSTSEALNES